MDFAPNKGRSKDFSISEAMIREPKPNREALYRGEYAGNKGGNYYSTDMEFARQFTQSGRDKEIMKRFLPKSDIYEAPTLPFAGNEQAMDAAMAEARKQGFKALRVNEGQGQPPSVFVLDKSALTKYGLVPAGLLGAGYAMAPSEAEAAPQAPAPQASQSTLGKLYDAVTTNPIGTFKAFGSAIGDSVKDYARSVYNEPSKGVADALELGVTSLGGLAPQAFWMATSPTEANAGEQAILDERIRRIAAQRGLLAD